MFIRSYFKGEKTPETAAMKAGKQTHGLIEGGFLSSKHRFDVNEPEIVIELDNGVRVLGRPDSAYYKPKRGILEFVDYKTGKENSWTRDKLSMDLKMKATAWLIYEKSKEEGHEPKSVKGYIEFFQTEWNGKEVVPIDGKESEVTAFTYSSEDLEKFTSVIKKTIDEVNAEYPKFLEASGEFVDEQDCLEYAKLEAEKEAIQTKQDEIKSRIAEAMEFGGEKSYESEVGTFYISERKTYEYPDDLEFKTEDGDVYTHEKAEQVYSAMKAAEKNYQVENEPSKVSKSVGFRKKK